jgi:dihydroorotase
MGLASEIGTLKVGALADVALFTLEKGEFPLYDVHMETRLGHELMRNTLTLVNGRELPRIPDGPMAPWMELNDRQRELLARGHDPESLVKRQRVAA